jgi:cyclic-di-GMP phosphodiesterase TipF (flagellum assembly factor)
MGMAQNTSRKPPDNNILTPGFFQRGPAGPRREPRELSEFLTFRNIVIGLGAATFLIFLGSVVSARIAFLFAALMGLTGLVLFEMTSRRKWEAELLDQLRRMNSDYDRLVRETARNRNDLSALKKGLSAAGVVARSYGNIAGDAPGAIEQRMVKAIAEHLAKIGAPPSEEGEGEGQFSALGALPQVDTKDETAVGRALSDEQVLQLVNAAVKQDRVDMFLQPIVGLPQRKMRFQEMFSRIRIRPGVYLPAERYIAVAMEQDLVPVIDNLLLLRGLQLIRDTEEENFNTAFFCNITSLTLNDPKFMGDLVEFIAQHRTLAPRLVFEMGQQDIATMSAESLPVLDGLAKLGCRFSMDQVRSMSLDFSLLEARHVRFVKAEAVLMMAAMKEPGGFQRLKRLKSELDSHGIDLIVEKIETDRQLLDLLDLEIDYGQGYLFGKPELSVQA